MKRAFAHGGVGLSVLFWLGAAEAQQAPGPRFGRPAVVVSQPTAPERSSSLDGHLAMSVAERLLASDDSDDRVRAVERLAGYGQQGQREAIDRLLRALSEGGPVLRDPRARLSAIRGL